MITCAVANDHKRSQVITFFQSVVRLICGHLQIWQKFVVRHLQIWLKWRNYAISGHMQEHSSFRARLLGGIFFVPYPPVDLKITYVITYKVEPNSCAALLRSAYFGTQRPGVS